MGIENVSYGEMLVISQIISAHLQELGDNLRAVVVFGDLITSGYPRNVELLEIVDEWSGPLQFSSKSSAELPLNGELLLTFLTPNQIKRPGDMITNGNPDVEARDRMWVEQTVRRVREGYAVVYEAVSGLVERSLYEGTSLSMHPSPASGTVSLTNPLFGLKGAA